MTGPTQSLTGTPARPGALRPIFYLQFEDLAPCLSAAGCEVLSESGLTQPGSALRPRLQSLTGSYRSCHYTVGMASHGPLLRARN